MRGLVLVIEGYLCTILQKRSSEGLVVDIHGSIQHGRFGMLRSKEIQSWTVGNVNAGDLQKWFENSKKVSEIA